MGKAFVNYFTHVTKSNYQYAVDSLKNDVSITDQKVRALWMGVQLVAGPEIFLKEAAVIERFLDEDLPADLGEGVHDVEAINAYLVENFLVPGFDGVAPINGEKYKPGLKKSVILKSTTANVGAAFAKLRTTFVDNEDGFSDVLDSINDQNGFENFDQLMDAAEDLYED